ncbi:MAG: permease [Fimbriimonadales bacterium]|nr:permease [Fimbriimonadales bacterium]
MDWKRERKVFAALAAAFLALFFLPVGNPRFDSAVLEALQLTRWYAREHVLTCLVPAFFIAGAIGVFVRKDSVLRYLGAAARRTLAYAVASVSGTLLAVCSCTVLPLFAGIHRMGAGLGPATAFLYSGPAVNVLAIILTARILGVELGIARAVGAVGFSVLIGLCMHALFRGEEREKMQAQLALAPPDEGRPLGQTALYFASMAGVLVFANWGRPDSTGGFWHAVHTLRWPITALFALSLAFCLVRFLGVPWTRLAPVAAATAALALALPSLPLAAFGAASIGLAWALAGQDGEPAHWLEETWRYAKQILPLLLVGVLAAGFLLGRPGHEGIVPSRWVEAALGGNSLRANLFAAVAGAFMYFATLSEVPILQGLLGSGMGKGPALALLLAGPALSLPSMLVLGTILGTRKTVAFVSLVVAFSTLAGWIYGALSG